MTPATRLNEINAALAAIQTAWPLVRQEIESLVSDLTESLISQNNEETRGRIKALRELMDLPEALESERLGILAAELPDPDSAL